VDRAVPSLATIIQGGAENDVSWFAAQALGKSNAVKNRELVISLLLTAVDRRPSVDYPAEAPHLRYHALAALVELANNDPMKISTEMQNRLATADAALSEKIGKALTEIQHLSSKE
jgi:hypothetical protein